MTVHMGPSQSRWYADGYQAAMGDVARAFVEGGQSAALEWVMNNLVGQRCPSDNTEMRWVDDQYVCPRCRNEHASLIEALRDLQPSTREGLTPCSAPISY